MKSKKPVLYAYVDAIYDGIEKTGYYGILLDGAINKEISGSVGSANDSSYCEYRAFSILIQKIRRYRKLFSKVRIYSDFQTLTRQLNEIIPPPKVAKLARSLREINQNLKRLKRPWEVTYIKSSDNPAHKVVREAFKPE